jgi:solute carrier family 25 S-adenosylmethionine transporter 26
MFGKSPQGFLKSGGFRGIYSGLGIAALGSAPGAALFFSSYETCKKFIPDIAGPGKLSDPSIHMLSASTAEVVACLVRVPTEVLKQRYQANLVQSNSSLWTNIAELRKRDGLAGFYRGYGSTILREIPFSLIQFPLYEWMKVRLSFFLCVSLSRSLIAFPSAPFYRRSKW